MTQQFITMTITITVKIPVPPTPPAPAGAKAPGEPAAEQGVGNALDTDAPVPLVKRHTLAVVVVAALTH